MRAQVLAECKAIDYGVTLEGDETIVELSRENRRNRSKACSIGHRRMNCLYRDREFILDLDRVPSLNTTI